MNKQDDDIVIEATVEETISTQPSNSLWDRLQKTYTVSLPAWGYAVLALLLALLILD